MKKELKGEKYIYLLMGYMLAKEQTKDYISVGNDNGMIGGQNYWRSFSVRKWNDKLLLIETKTTAHSANFTRTYELLEGKSRVYIYEYIDEVGDNHSTNWVH